MRVVFKTAIPKIRRGVFFAIMAILALFVGFSRVCLDVYYYTDVVTVGLPGLLWKFVCI